MLLKKLQIAILALPVLPALVAAAEPTGLQVRVVNIAPASGTVEVTLFNSPETFMKEPYLQQAAEVGEDGAVEVRFAGLIEGEYAAVAVHDANENGKLDTGFLGFGGESYGWSNNVAPWFGWPDFEDAAFTAGFSNLSIEIDLD